MILISVSVKDFITLEHGKENHYHRDKNSHLGTVLSESPR